jgi:hypothetical protein
MTRSHDRAHLPSLADRGDWLSFGADPRFDYPIDYSIRILGWSAETQSVDFLGKWAPNSYCHFHRHLGATTSLVLEGEHHTVETIDGREIHQVRGPGDYAQKGGGGAHMEYAGPQGSLVFFRMEAVDGQLFEVLGRGERVLASTPLAEFVAGNLPR